MWYERVVIGAAAALWAALVPGGATTCLDHRWELPSRLLRRRLEASGPELAGHVAGAGQPRG